MRNRSSANLKSQARLELFARQHRCCLTESEARLWSTLKARQLGVSFRAATRIGYSAEMGKMCTHMGAGVQGFTEQALAFHHTADSIATAARKHDRPAVMTALGTTLQTCTACHETFRERVVDQATWTRLTSMPAPTGHHPGG